MLARLLVATFPAAMLLAGFARAAALEFSINIGDGPLSFSLKALEAQTGVELLYDGNLTREFRAPPVNGKFSTEAALLRMLSETDLTVRRSSSGAWIIERKSTPPLARQDAPVAEVLVVGRLTQNADIRRTEDDIQPHVVATQTEILSAHRDNIDQFISSRITANTTTIPSIASQDAAVRSSIDLRGLGESDTLVLVDGRRMPSIGDADNGFAQSDVAAIPLHAIDRIEVLTGSAGGIHGFGALGGVVNVVLDRNIEGLEFHGSQGISSRNDSRRHGLDVSFGQAFRDGATSFMLSTSYQDLDTPLIGDRPFAVRDRRQTYKVAPDYFPSAFINGGRIMVYSIYGMDPETGELVLEPELTFKPEFGGGSIGHNFTSLPTGLLGDDAALLASLEQLAGAPDLTISQREARSDLGSNPRAQSFLANFQHRFDRDWEIYADAVMLRTRGESSGSTGSARLGLYSGSALVAPESPANPFNEFVVAVYPIPGMENHVRRRFDNRRYTAGVEAGLPLGWRGIAEATWGEFEYRYSDFDEFSPLGLSFLLFGDESDLETNPFGNWRDFARVITTDPFRSWTEFEFRTRFRAQSLRLAGPVFDTRSGATTLTLLAERRSERVPPGIEIQSIEWGGPRITNEFREDPRTRLTYSYYGELRSRVFDDSLRARFLRGLEMQLAVRRDEQRDSFQRNEIMPDEEIRHSRVAATAFTAGMKVSPSRAIMIRASYATGEQPQPIRNLSEYDPMRTSSGSLTDKKRGDTPIGVDGEYLLLVGGNPALDTARAHTWSIGTVLTPAGAEGPRIALDYSRIRRSRDALSFTDGYTLDHEEQWPERVVRQPLTDADQLLGYTAGAIESLDVRLHNDGAVEVDAFDMRAEWPLSFLGGRLKLYADATYHKNNLHKSRFEPNVQHAGFLDGPLARRANGGFDWSKGSLSVGANVQYFGSMLIFSHGLLDSNETAEVLQGSARIPSQSYLDLYATWRLPMRSLLKVDGLTLDLGIVNALDKAPPRETAGTLDWHPGYSRYGDARMRRFELGISARF